MPAFIDLSCQKCGKRYGFAGEPKDAPPCPRCGAKPDVAVLEADELELQRFRDLILGKRD